MPPEAAARSTVTLPAFMDCTIGCKQKPMRVYAKRSMPTAGYSLVFRRVQDRTEERYCGRSSPGASRARGLKILRLHAAWKLQAQRSMETGIQWQRGPLSKFLEIEIEIEVEIEREMKTREPPRLSTSGLPQGIGAADASSGCFENGPPRVTRRRAHCVAYDATVLETVTD